MNLTESISLSPARFQDAQPNEIVINIAPGEWVDTDGIIDKLCKISGIDRKSITEDDYFSARDRIEEYIERFWKSHPFVKVWINIDEIKKQSKNLFI